MTQQRYSIKEAVNRLYRLFTGQTPPIDSPNTLPGTIFSTDEAVSYLAEVFAGSMPNVTGTFPPGLLPINTPNNYITKKECGVYAYLATGTSTTIVSGTYWYPIQGPFVNDPFQDFTIQSDQITYAGTLAQYFEIDWHCTASCTNNNNVTCDIGIKVNGITHEECVMGTFLKTTNEQAAFSGTIVHFLAPGDTIQLIITSDGDGDIILIRQFTTTIKQFFY